MSTEREFPAERVFPATAAAAAVPLYWLTAKASDPEMPALPGVFSAKTKPNYAEWRWFMHEEPPPPAPPYRMNSASRLVSHRHQPPPPFAIIINGWNPLAIAGKCTNRHVVSAKIDSIVRSKKKKRSSFCIHDDQNG